MNFIPFRNILSKNTSAKTTSAKILRIPRNLIPRESENAIREIAFETRVKIRSRLLLWTRVLLKVLDFLIRRPRTSKNLVRQDPDLFMAMFHILPPPTPKVRSYLSSAALKPLFFAIGLILATG